MTADGEISQTDSAGRSDDAGQSAGAHWTNGAAAREPQSGAARTSGDDLRARARAAIESALIEAEAEFERPAEDHFVVNLPGTHRLKTACSLLLGDYTLSVNAFVVRAAEENHAGVYRWLLERNARLSGIAFALDKLGDVYLVGRLPLAAVTAEEVDRLLGSVLDAADSSFDQLLELGFAESIRREWAWRLKRGESTANLAAFQRLRPSPAEVSES